MKLHLEVVDSSKIVYGSTCLPHVEVRIFGGTKHKFRPRGVGCAVEIAASDGVEGDEGRWDALGISPDRVQVCSGNSQISKESD